MAVASAPGADTLWLMGDVSRNIWMSKSLDVWIQKIYLEVLTINVSKDCQIQQIDIWIASKAPKIRPRFGACSDDEVVSGMPREYASMADLGMVCQVPNK